MLGESYNKWADDFGRVILEWSTNAKFYDTEGKQTFPLPTKGWPLTDFGSAFAIASAYFAFVIVGRLVMIALPSFHDFTYPLRFAYNVGQVMLCAYMTVEAGLIAYRNNYTLIPCNVFDSKNPPVANVLWLFYVSKIFDFFDTFFIIVGKKWDQLSFLHVYHHLTIFMIYWVNVNVGYDGDVYLTVVLNGFIHTVMYTYYFVSLHTREIWWKKYLTMMQMVQFLTMNVQAIYLLAVDCRTFPPRVTASYLFYIMTLFGLFLNFFIKSYMGSGKVKSSKSKKQ